MSNMHHISNSEIQCFKRCRRKWWLTYYRRLRPINKKTASALGLGTRVHAALEAYYSLDPRDPVEVLREEYEKARATLDVNDPEQTELTKEYDLAHAMIEGYVEWLHDTGVDDDLEVIDVERELSVELDAVPVTLIGKLDARVRRRSDGRILSMDHKTCMSFDTLTRTLELNEQPLLYRMLERLTLPAEEHTSDGIFNMLRKVKRTARSTPPYYMREIIHHNDDNMRNYWKRLHGVLAEMLRTEERLNNGEDFQEVVYPTANDNCNWDCDFRAVCPMFDDGSHAEGVLESTFAVHDPYERYTEVTE